jgi:hypothetical protein
VQYMHPLDGNAVLRTSVEKVAFYNPTPHVLVHKDYLRDYLAARRGALLVSAVADRFWNAPERVNFSLKHSSRSAFLVRRLERERGLQRSWGRTVIVKRRFFERAHHSTGIC